MSLHANKIGAIFSLGVYWFLLTEGVDSLNEKRPDHREGQTTALWLVHILS